MRALQYLLQYSLERCHKPGKSNFVPAALSCLAVKPSSTTENNKKDIALEDLLISA
jgi:hypothetical protein